ARRRSSHRRGRRAAERRLHPPRRPDRPRPPEGRRPRPRARILAGRGRAGGAAAHGRPRRVPLGRRLPPPRRAQHLGERRRLAAPAGHHRPLPRGLVVSGPAGAGRGAAARAGRRHRAGRRFRPRGERGALPARPGRQRGGALPRPRPGGVAPRRRRRPLHAHAPAGRAGAAGRSPRSI
ncbi:MAG: Glyoxalase family protein, partial [uncultured Acetobacteraceae bacterium]